MMHDNALGIFETVGYVPALAGADAALKAANVVLHECKYAGSGLVSVHLIGDVSSVKAAIDAACEAATMVGELKWQTIIARTADGLELLFEPQVPHPVAVTDNGGHAGVAGPDRRALEKMRVRELREMATKLPTFSLPRWQIRSASKAELIDAIFDYELRNKE